MRCPKASTLTSTSGFDKTSTVVKQSRLPITQMKTTFMTNLGNVLIWSLLIFSDCACSKSAVYEKMSDIPRFGKHFLTVKPHRTTWVHKNQFGHGVGKIEMTLADLEDLNKKKGLDCQFVLEGMEHVWAHFEGCFDVDPETKVYSMCSQICPSERGCQFYGYFAPNTASVDGVGTLWFFIQ